MFEVGQATLGFVEEPESSPVPSPGVPVLQRMV